MPVPIIFTKQKTVAKVKGEPFCHGFLDFAIGIYWRELSAKTISIEIPIPLSKKPIWLFLRNC